MFFVSVAADVDPESYAWLVFKRSTKMRLTGYNQRHTLVLEKGDIYGVRKTRSNTYQLIKADAMHVLYRNISQKVHDNMLGNSAPYRGATPTVDIEPGYLRARKRAVNQETANKRANKMKDDYWRTNKPRVVETYSLDLNDYQWRKIGKGPLRIETKKQGKSRGTVQSGDVIGLRYSTPARGGYVLFKDNQRVHISHELYTQLVHASRILPATQQRSGVIDIETGAVEAPSPDKLSTKRAEKELEKNKVSRRLPRMPKVELPPEEPIEKLYDLDALDDDELLNKVSRRSKRNEENLRRHVRKLIDKAPEEETLDEDWQEDDEEDFEEEDFEEDDEDSVDDADSEDFTDEDEGEQEENNDDVPAADNLEPGTIIKITKGREREFVVLDAQIMERNENLMEYMIYDPESDADEFVVHRLRLNVHLTTGDFKKSAEIVGDYPEGKLKKLQDQLGYAIFKPISLVK